MCDRCEFPLGQDVGLETRRLDTTELKVLEKSLYPMPKEKQCILHVPKKKEVNFRDMEVPGSSHQVLSLPSFLHISHSLIFFPLNFCIHSHHKKKKWRTQWYCKNSPNRRRQKDKSVSASRIILASQKLLLPLKLLSWSSEDSWDSANSQSYLVSDQKTPGRRPSWDFFQTVSAPPVTLQYICLPEDCPKSRGMGRVAIPERTTSQLWQRRASLCIGKESGLPAKGALPALVCSSGICAHRACPNLPRKEKPGRDGKGVLSPHLPPVPASSRLL